jgi:hypothetical protein
VGERLGVVGRTSLCAFSDVALNEPLEFVRNGTVLRVEEKDERGSGEDGDAEKHAHDS